MLSTLPQQASISGTSYESCGLGTGESKLNDHCSILTVHRWLVAVAVTAFACANMATANAQSGLRESLEQLDVNENGSIDPDEVTPLARPYLERITEARRMPMDRPMPIDKLQEAARIYYALKNGIAGKPVYAESRNTVKPFGTDPDESVVPEFGLSKVKYPYTIADVEEADQTLRRYDRNDDGFIDRPESDKAKWTHLNPFDSDLNKDDRLSRMELIQRYARRRLMSGVAGELVKKAVRTGNDIRPSAKPVASKDDSQWWRQGGSSHWLTASMLGRFDTNRNGSLEPQEAQQTGFSMGQIDIDRDGIVTRDELHALLTKMQQEAGDLTEGLPGWFYELDSDKDGQIAVHEFETEWTIARHEQFEALDINGDGLLTASEVLKSRSVIGGAYRNEDAEILAPHRTVISEIEVEDDYLIRDVNVQISITHTSTGYLDGYLTGPNGERIELFAEAGGSGDHFEKTTFDDEADTPISKGRSPFSESYKPRSLEKGQPGLGTFKGKSTKGVWQLIIRGTRSDRFGMLHSWGLTVVPEEVIPDAPQPEVDPDAIAESTDPDSADAADTMPQQPDEISDKDKPAKTESPSEGFKLPFKLF